MPKVTSTRRKNQLESKTKVWLKRHDPAYMQKMKEKNHDKDLKKKRNEMSRVRRAGHSAAYTVFKKLGPLKDKDDNSYVWNEKYKRLTRNDCEVVRRARDGSIHFFPYEDEEELDDDKFDLPIPSDVDKGIVENVEKLFNGDEELERKMKKRKIVITKELSDEDCFWKNLTSEEKTELLRKLKKTLKIKD